MLVKRLADDGFELERTEVTCIYQPQTSLVKEFLRNVPKGCPKVRDGHHVSA